MENCVNHPARKALSICHNCGRRYCESCLDEGKEFYYCKDPACQKALLAESPAKLSPEALCPNCSSELELSKEDRTSRRFHCPECKALIDYSVDPPRILKVSEYSLLLSTMNQGDIALVKSILEKSNITYYVFDEEFLSVRPLVQPARLYVADDQMEEARELVKELKLHLFGMSDGDWLAFEGTL